MLYPYLNTLCIYKLYFQQVNTTTRCIARVYCNEDLNKNKRYDRYKSNDDADDAFYLDDDDDDDYRLVGGHRHWIIID